MIANPQSLNRLGHFLTPDCKPGGTPSGGLFKSGGGKKQLLAISYITFSQ